MRYIQILFSFYTKKMVHSVRIFKAYSISNLNKILLQYFSHGKSPQIMVNASYTPAELIDFNAKG